MQQDVRFKWIRRTLSKEETDIEFFEFLAISSMLGKNNCQRRSKNVVEYVGDREALLFINILIHAEIKRSQIFYKLCGLKSCRADSCSPVGKFGSPSFCPTI